MERWKGRVALVTGASSGIGSEIAFSLAKAGMKVVTCGRRLERLEELRSQSAKNNGFGEIHPLRCDVSKSTEIIEMFEAIRTRYNRLDVCVNSAGVGNVEATLLDGREEEWKEMLDVNLLGLCVCTREAIKLMNESGVDDGQIIHISSVIAHGIGVGGFFYTSTKHALKVLTEGLRLELLNRNSDIRIATISPGFVKTEMAEDVMTKYQIPANHSLDPSSVADCVIHILSCPANVQVHDIIVRATGSRY